LRVADAIEARYVTPKADDRQTREQFASRLAYHYYQAASEADPRKIVRYLIIAGERAMSAAAFEDALIHFDRAVSLIQPDDASRAEPLFGRGLAKRSLGQWEGALADWRDALSNYEQLKDVDAVGRVAWSMTIQLLWGGRYLEALEIGRRGLICLGERVNADRCMLLGAAGLTISFGGYYPAGNSMITQALAMAESMGDERLLGRALTFASVHHLSWMEYPQAIETGLRSADLLRPHGDLWFVADALWSVQDAALGIGLMKEVARLGEELEDFGSRLGHQAATLFAGSNRALMGLMRSGDIDAFEEFARNDVKLRRKLGFPWVSQCYTWMGLCEFWRGQWEEAIKHFDESLEVDEPAFFTGSAWAFVFMANAYTGGRGKALSLLERYRSSLPKFGQNNTASAWTMLPSVIEGLTILGERNQAAELYSVVLDAIRTGTLLPWDIGQLFQLAAGIAAAAGRDWDSAEDHYEAALRQADEVPIVIQQPEVRRWYARMLLERRHRGDRRRALQLIAQAIEGYRRIGMPRHVEMAQALAGGPKRDQRQWYPDGLTEREVEILRLVAEGRTSREIGDELVLSMRTVERHITNIYAKINAHTRAQATAYALARGLWTPSP
ncbi:MAG TPA: LuxR C-terminal-related transcriptional regulator, partial [Dehalococcoidia bacterium]|nr:LuxR C-terminal-related transcriptional regulator [Dehalococcoidia bacterium]